MNLGEVGPGCPRCGRGPHEGECPKPPFPPNQVRSEWEIPERRPDKEDPTPKIDKALLGVCAVVVVLALLYLLWQADRRERAEWKAEWLRRTELCEAQGGIPRYAIRGRSYEGCDFPKEPSR